VCVRERERERERVTVRQPQATHEIEQVTGLNTSEREGQHVRTRLENPVDSELFDNFFTEMCSGSEAGSYLRLTDFVYHSTLGLRVTKKNGVRLQRSENARTSGRNWRMRWTVSCSASPKRRGHLYTL